MSWQASAWAVEQQEITYPTARHVLLCMANYADADGRAAFPSVLRLARDTGLSESAVRRSLRTLEKFLLIRRGSPAIVAAHIKRSDRRPASYDLLIARGSCVTPRETTRVSPNGVSLEPARGSCVTPDPP